jgi:type I restriction-modification system DNA methylase subunit
MDSQQTFSHLLERLEYKSSPNLISSDTSPEKIPEDIKTLWHEAQEKLHVDAVYFLANIPIIYFRQFEAFDRQEIAKFHQKVWNQSLVPLIFVILPNYDIRVYNGYKVPRRATNTHELDEPSRLDYELGSSRKEPSTQPWESQDQESSTQLWERLATFTHTAIESGSFWRDYGDHFDRETRADQKLIANLRYIRQELIKDLKPEYAHNLIGRSIFALYLQDRGVLSSGILPAGEDSFFAREFSGKYSRCTDLLESHPDTYAFFEIIRKQFNGDMFPVTDDEKSTVTSDHLATLRRLFTIDSIEGGQMLFFWAYNFEFIPIELISAIYEEFLHQEESGKDGAYYTPPMLVDFMLNQVLPRGDQDYILRLLDPACGSGIFLVEAYRRLVERWRKAHGRRPDSVELAAILKYSIFGVDIKLQALRVAAFSLYLAMLDYVEPKSIWMTVHFPPLIGTNLVEADFFEEQISFGDDKFDIVVGNPPWVSKLTSYAKDFLRKRGYKVGDEQIVQAFLWHAPDFCNADSQIALLCSSKSLLFNKSYPNIKFRRDFFRKFNVRKVFDFSALRRYIFENAIAPATAIIYTPQKPDFKSIIFYGSPKLTPLAHRFAAIVIETNDLKQDAMPKVV